MNRNIFLVIECYLVTPTDVLAAKIKALSHSLTKEAYAQAKIKFAHKKIGADEYGIILLDNIEKSAEKALQFSTRLIKNEQVSPNDPACIFKISSAQQIQIRSLIGQLLGQQGSNYCHPDGLIFAYDGYIERRMSSNFSYCEGIEAVVYDHNAQLSLKARSLLAGGHDEAALILSNVCSNINQAARSFSTADSSCWSRLNSLLAAAKQNPRLLPHSDVQQIMANLLRVTSDIGLAPLASIRGSFWHHPNTNSENTLDGLTTDLNPQKK
ncbi:MAG: hypothetical protein ACHP65_08030 [Legionellales bacterium]